MKIVKFNKDKYPFDKLVSSLYNCDLNQLNDNKDYTYLDNKSLFTKENVGKDSDSIFHKVFYDKLREGWPELIHLYEEFLIKEIGILFKEEEEIIYQKTPSYRVNQPGGKAVYISHSDGDKNHNHPSGEINIFLPLTKAYGNNTIWVESIPGLGDYSPIEIKFGEFLMFYGNKLRHFNKINNTGKTRCSFDFRIIPPINYDDSYKGGSAILGKEFLVGGYYKKIKK
mgnify:FL=1